MNAIGTDVSKWQDANSTPQKINFVKMKAAGADFVFMKASQANWADEDIAYNWSAAKAAGLLRGAYHFLDWVVDPVKQADFFCSLIEHDPGELPPVCDYEWWNMDNIPSNVLTILKRFLERVEVRLGVVPMIYTAPGFWQPYGSTDPYWKHYYLWIASWGNMNPSVPAPWTEYTFHQYSSKGDGLKYGAESLNIDMDQFNGTRDELMAFANAEIPPVIGDRWSKSAVGLYTYDTLTQDDIEGYDFIISETGDCFTDNVQTAYDAEIPCILFESHVILKWHVDFGINKDNWPTPDQEQLIRLLDTYIMMGDVKRAVHGIMLNCQYVTDEQGNPLTVTWWVERCRHMLNMIYARYQLPIYLYMNKDPINTYNTGEAKESVFKLCKDFGVSVVDFASALTVDEFPLDTDNPWQPFVGADYPWYFWLFDNSPLRFLYNGTQEQLYAALDYEAYPPFPPDPEPDPDDEPLLERIEDLEQIVIELSDDVEEMKQFIQAAKDKMLEIKNLL